MFKNLKIIISSDSKASHLKLREILSSVRLINFTDGSLISPHINIESLFDLNLVQRNFRSPSRDDIKFHLLILEMDDFNLEYLHQIQLLHKIEPDLFIIIASKETTHWRDIIKFLGLNAKVLFLKTPFNETETINLIQHICYERWVKQYFNDYLFNQLELKVNSCNPVSTALPTNNVILDVASFEQKLGEILSEGYIKRYNTALACITINNVTSVKGRTVEYITEHLLNDVKERLLTYAHEDWHLVYWNQGSFGIAIPQVTDHKICETQLLNLYDRLTEPYTIYDSELIISISIGVSLSDTIVTLPVELTTQAQNAARANISQRRSHVIFYNTHIAQKKIRSLMLEAELRKAIREDQFEIYYQPIIDMKKNAVSSLEILVRWVHPTLGLLLPHEFINLADEANLLTSLNELILEKGMSQAKQWTKKGIKIAFNVTVDHLLSEGFLETLQGVCFANKIPTHLVELEITEEQALENSLNVIHTIHKIKQYGYQFVLDDFGVGYSSLLYLNSFPVDKIKIDRSFLLTNSTKQRSIIIAIIDLCQKLGIRTVCEGVEDYRQYVFLSHAHCDEIQGFLFSPPLQVSDVDAFIESFSISNVKQTLIDEG